MPDRIILIDKPYRWTSFDVVKKLRKPLLEERRMELPEPERRQLKNYKVGHAGTLDPLATGLLVLCTGKFTSKITEIQSQEKEYTGTIVIGAVTESYDLEKPVIQEQPFEHISEADIAAAVSTFTGPIRQVPPAHSAVKIDGVRAYEHARKGVDIEIAAKEVTIYEFEITGITLPEIYFRIVCSKGTYIRSIAHDLGKELKTGGYLSALRRTRIGSFRVEDAFSPADFLHELSGNKGLA
jgi:tRNA pseudouridine55 synthase